jgi:hypothetical protein
MASASGGAKASELRRLWVDFTGIWHRKFKFFALLTKINRVLGVIGNHS